MFAAYEYEYNGDPVGGDGPPEDLVLFNQPIGAWDVSNVNNMDFMFKDNFDFNQDLSSWCVVKIPTMPKDFTNSAWTFPKPVWGTCPD
ncbi:MAG TPA: BspA family leucine-rich repeat surface protein [Algoriphagus sp.]|nr:BspA family leucine-rich repeat surface protein [Algoriphagus sp.]